MRDIPLLLGVLIMVPMIFVRPYLGVLAWGWTALLVPNAFVYGLAANIRFNFLIAITTAVAWLLSREPKRIPLSATSVLLGCLLVWATVSALFTANTVPSDTWMEWERLVKIILFSLAVIGLLRNQTRITALLFTIVLSMGFHGFLEAGKFILTAGRHHIWGPGSSIIGDNNAFALAVVMTIPILAYLYTYSRNLFIRVAMAGGIFLLIVVVIGTRSRGGFIGIVALGLWIFVTTRKKFRFLVVALPFALMALALAPERWYERMSTIESAEQDSSFMGRVIAWKINALAAMDRPLSGAGFRSTQDLPVWLHYAQEFWRLDMIPTTRPDSTMAHAAHSIYFQVLGDMGFVGLAIYLLLLVTAWRNTSRAIKQTRDVPAMKWAHDLARTFQYCLVPFIVCGAALNMAYFDLAFAIFALAAVLKTITKVPAVLPMPTIASSGELREAQGAIRGLG
jgi:probable O-glycosylation ligase (exosortase A-associated)